MEHSPEPVTRIGQAGTSIPMRLGRWIGAGLLVLLLPIAGWLYLQSHRSTLRPGSNSQRSVTAVTVGTRTVSPTASPLTVEVTGTVHAQFEAPISARVIARVQRVLVNEGDRVRKGQELIFLEGRDLDAAVSQANASLRTAGVGYDNACIAARMEASLSAARIAEARSKLAQSEAARKTAEAKLDMVAAGPRRQERQEAVLAVSLAKSNLSLAESTLVRMAALFKEGAISALQYDQYHAQFEVAKTQFEAARQSKSIVDEGSRAEELRAAQQAVLQARAGVQEAEAGLKSAQANVMLVDLREKDIEGAEARIGQSRAGLQIATVTRDYATIDSPFDGVISKRLANPGLMANPGVQLLTIQGGSLRLEAIVPESVLNSVRKGASVPVRLDALGQRALVGRVIEIAPQGDSSSHSFVVKVMLPPGTGAAPGMFGRARLTTGTEMRLTVPASALTEREGLYYLYVVDGSRHARLRMVTVGEVSGDRVPVLSGLNSGERIVTTGRELVTDGSLLIEGSR